MEQVNQRAADERDIVRAVGKKPNTTVSNLTNNLQGWIHCLNKTKSRNKERIAQDASHVSALSRDEPQKMGNQA